MTDYGEPWISFEHDEFGEFVAVFQDGKYPEYEQLGTKGEERVLTCVNALAGCPDPDGFVEAVREIRKSFAHGYRNTAVDDFHKHPALSWLREGK